MLRMVERRRAQTSGITDERELGSRNRDEDGRQLLENESGEPQGTFLPFGLPSCKTHALDNTELHGVRHKHSQDGNV